MQLKIPLIQAPMAGGITTSKLVSAVCEAGALGSIGAGYLPPEAIEKLILETEEKTKRPFQVNLFIPPNEKSNVGSDEMKAHLKKLWKQIFNKEARFADFKIPSFDEQIEVLLASKISIFSFTFGMLSPEYVKRFKSKGVYLIGTATTPKEAIALERRGVDAIICQGYEAGGHRGGFSQKDPFYTLSTLLMLTRKEVSLPLIAAGGLMTIDSIRSALKGGASYVQLGTAFLTTHESGAHPAYKEMLLKSDRQTQVTPIYTGKNARGIENEMMKTLNDLNIPNYPLQHLLTQGLRKEAKKQDLLEWMSLWAGQGYPLCKKQSAHELITSLKKAWN